MSQFAMIACCAFLSIPINARDISLTNWSEITQEGVNASNPQHGSNIRRQDSMTLLMRLATEQITADHEFLGKIRFSINQHDHTLFYDLRPAPTKVVLSERDPYSDPLEALIRAEALRRDFGSTIPNETFWSSALNSAEQAIQRCVQALENSQPARNALGGSEECVTSVDDHFDKLKTSILTYASANGLKTVPPSDTRDPVIGYRVHIGIDPPKARVRVMTLLEYKKYQYSQTPQAKYQWNDLLATDNDMIGWYHYRAEWPKELNGPDEGDFEVKGPITLTFKPNPK